MNKFIITAALLVVVVLTSSCKKWLDLEPEDGVTQNEYWKTKEQVYSAVIGCYSSLLGNPSSSDNDRTLAEYLFLWGELRADMIAANSSVKADETSVLNGIITQDLSICKWRAVYRTINYCNTVIEKAPQVQAYDNSFTDSQLHQYLSEALTLRSLMYFYLVRTFKEVPLKLTATLSDETVLQIAKSPADSILARITKDLNTARDYAVYTHGSSYLDKGRVTKYTVNTLLADVYLWSNQYDSCAKACDYVINSGQFGLVSTYSDLFTKGNTTESIFEFQFDKQALNPFYTMLNLSTGRRFLAAQRVIDDIYTIDETDPENNYDRRGDGASLSFSTLAIWKYLGLNSSTSRTAATSYAPWIVYRYADILLMKAEALAYLGRGSESLELVNTIRNRARAVEGTKLTPDADDVDGLVDYILQERAREFSFEGKRWFDLLRVAKRENYRRKNILTDMISIVAPTDRQMTMVNNIKDTLSHYLPIYYYELSTDKKLVQNAFYKQQ